MAGRIDQRDTILAESAIEMVRTMSNRRQMILSARPVQTR